MMVGVAMTLYRRQYNNSPSVYIMPIPDPFGLSQCGESDSMPRLSRSSRILPHCNNGIEMLCRCAKYTQSTVIY